MPQIIKYSNLEPYHKFFITLHTKHTQSTTKKFYDSILY